MIDEGTMVAAAGWILDEVANAGRENLDIDPDAVPDKRLELLLVWRTPRSRQRRGPR